MAFLDAYKHSATRVANFAVRDQFRFDRSSTLGRFYYAGLKCYRAVDRRGPQKLYVKLGGYSTRSFRFAALRHQVMCGGPVRVAVEQCSDNSTVQDAGKRLMMQFGLKLGDILIAFNEGSNVQPLLIRRSAPETDAIR